MELLASQCTDRLTEQNSDLLNSQGEMQDLQQAMKMLDVEIGLGQDQASQVASCLDSEHVNMKRMLNQSSHVEEAYTSAMVDVEAATAAGLLIENRRQSVADDVAVIQTELAITQEALASVLSDKEIEDTQCQANAQAILHFQDERELVIAELCEMKHQFAAKSHDMAVIEVQLTAAHEERLNVAEDVALFTAELHIIRDEFQQASSELASGECNLIDHN